MNAPATLIRDAEVGDIPALLDMGERFARLAKVEQHVGFCRDSVANTLLFLIEAPLGIILIADAGAIGGLAHPHPYNQSHTTGIEMFWWSEGRTGLRLKSALENRARELGCKTWTMITLESVRPDALAHLYLRDGYKPLERSFIKEL